MITIAPASIAYTCLLWHLYSKFGVGAVVLSFDIGSEDLRIKIKLIELHTFCFYSILLDNMSKIVHFEPKTINLQRCRIPYYRFSTGSILLH